MFLDFVAAFDTIPAEQAIASLVQSVEAATCAGSSERHQGMALAEWVRQFVSRRRFRVGFGDRLSSVRRQDPQCPVGVPQGTVVGPYVWKAGLEPIIEEVRRRFPDIEGIFCRV